MRFLLSCMSLSVHLARSTILRSDISLMSPGPGQITTISDISVFASKSAVFSILTCIHIVDIIRAIILVKLSSLSMMVAVFHSSCSHDACFDCSRKWNLERCLLRSESICWIILSLRMSCTSGGIFVPPVSANCIPRVLSCTS